MQDILMKWLYSGVGMAALTAETVKQTIDKLVDDRKLSVEEGKKIVDEFLNNFQNTEAKKADFEGQVSKIFDKVTKSFGFVPATEVEALQSRIGELEAELAEKKKPAAKKTTASKTKAADASK
jgi:polyhydroxyalkanoate synthesis regulator phasin